MNNFNNFKEASREYATQSVKGLQSWYESIRLASIRIAQQVKEDKRIKNAILTGLVKFFKVNKDGEVTERTERHVAPLDGYVRTSNMKATNTYKMFDLDKIKEFVSKGIEEEKAKLMSIISFNRWQFEYDI